MQAVLSLRYLQSPPRPLLKKRRAFLLPGGDKMATVDWTEEQITVALYEYCRRPFGQFSGTKPFVIELAKMLHRTPGAIVRKIGNLAHFDPQMKARGVGGLEHTSKLDKIIWDKYFGHWSQLAYDAELLIANFKEKSFDESLEESIGIDISALPQGTDREQVVKRRINQDFFRRTILSSYNYKCCITGINNPLLLHSSHIVGWSEDEENRTNPQNGLCLNVLLHKAYDDNLLGISPDYEVFISDLFLGERMKDVEEGTLKYFRSLNKTKLILPSRFHPDKDLLAIHYESYRQNI